MNGFQIFGISLSAFFILLLALAVVRLRISRRAATVWIGLWTAAGVTIAWPQLTVVVAHALGIARGADLVFYCAILAGFAAFLSVYVKLRRLDSQLTELTRDLALERARRDRTVPPLEDP